MSIFTVAFQGEDGLPPKTALGSTVHLENIDIVDILLKRPSQTPVLAPVLKSADDALHSEIAGSTYTAPI